MAMSKRSKVDISYQLKGVPFAEMWASGNETGGQFGIKTGLRDIHITIYMRGNIQNVHITDTGKDPRKIWEKEITVEEIVEIGKEMEKDFVKRYYWFQSYYQFSDELAESIIRLGKPIDDNINKYDITPLVYAAHTESSLVKKRIRRGYIEGNKPGLLFKGEDSFFIFPYEKNRMFFMNADLRKTLLYKFPTVEGMYRYLDYLEQEGILEQSKRFDEDKRLKFQAAMLEIYREKGIM